MIERIVTSSYPARRPGRRELDRAGGFTLVELVIVVGIVGILAAAVLPLARWSLKRQQEYQLQSSLRILRTAIDRYHDLAMAGLIEIDAEDPGFPPDLETLVNGVMLTGPLPAPAPPVAGDYWASGFGLSGGVAGAAAAAGAGMGAGGSGELGAPGGRGGFGTPGGDRGGRSGRGGAASGGRNGLQSLFQQQGGAMGNIVSQLQRSDSPLSQGLSESQRAAVGSLVDNFRQQGGDAAGGFLADREVPRATLGDSAVIVLLRRIPLDPFTGEANWGRRCYGEPIADRSWCGRNVFDVYSEARGRGIDGRPYREW